MLKLDFIPLFERIPNAIVRHRLLDRFMEFFVPFSRWLGLHIAKLSPEEVEIHSPDRVRRRNHVGGAHACALALLGEYPAGMILAQNFPVNEYRIIISQISIDYHKQGKGKLRSVSKRPERFEEPVDGKTWVDMITEIFDKEDDLVATCKSKWQVKRWSQTKA